MNRKTKILSMVGIFFLVTILPLGYQRYQHNSVKAEKSKLWTERPYLTVIGPICLADGIGRQSVELVNALKDEFTIGVIADSKSKQNFKDYPRKTKKIIKHNNMNLGKVVIYEDVLWVPENKKDQVQPRDAASYFKAITDDEQIRIAYSMLEATRIPFEWVIILNSYFDAVAVPDPFLVEVYQKSGVKVPVFCLPLGLDLSKFLKQPLKEGRDSPEAPMVFANFSACINRKNHIALVRAFAKAFGNSHKVVLQINSRNGHADDVAALEAEIAKLKVENIFFSRLCLSNEVYLKNFQTVDCYVSLSKSEGFSIQPREAMALGIPVIATDNTAQHTICESGLVKAVASKITEPAFYWSNAPFGYRFNCDESEVALALRDMYNNYSFYLSRAAEAREWAAQYDYENLKGLYKTLVRPDQIHLGHENKITEDCLITNSESLYRKYVKHQLEPAKAQEKKEKKRKKSHNR